MELTETEDNQLKNLLMNMNGGLLPVHLSQNEVALLTKWDEHWFENLGYDDDYERPKNV